MKAFPFLRYLQQTQKTILNLQRRLINRQFYQIPDFDQVCWLSIVAAIMSFTYSGVGLSLGIAEVAENKSVKGSLTGISIGTITRAGPVTPTNKLWRSFQALGAIAFAYSYSIILIEIQDTVKSPPAEYKIMKKATALSIAVTTVSLLVHVVVILFLGKYCL